MKVFQQIGIVFAFGWCGSFLARFVQVGIPASVWALLLLLAALRFRCIRPDAIDVVGTFLATNMAIFFLPSAAGILDCIDILRPVLLPLLAVCVVGTALTFLATYYSVRWARRLFANTDEKEKQ